MTECLCNLCGLSLFFPSDQPFLDKNPDFEGNGLIKICVDGGYNSTPGNGDGALDDCSAYSFSLCEFCLDYLFCQFKIPVKVLNYLEDECEQEFLSAEIRVLGPYRPQKAKFFAEKSRRDNARKNKNI